MRSSSEAGAIPKGQDVPEAIRRKCFLDRVDQMCGQLCCWTGRLKTGLASGTVGVEGPKDLAAAIPAKALGESHLENREKE